MLGVVFVMLGAARLYAPSLLGRRALLLPAGALVYIAVPPARDFATSGLENGLVLAYLGLLWWMMVCWSQQRADGEPRVHRPALAFVAGLSVLVRPELALIGGLALVMMLVAARGWRRRLLIVVAGGLLPVAYQIFRMGYYGLLVPGTALAKDASGKKWAQGFVYLANFNRPTCCGCRRFCWSLLGALVLVGRSRPWWMRAPAPRRSAAAGAAGAEPDRRRRLHRRQRAAAGRVLDPPGRRLHARPGAADAVVLRAGAGRGDPGGAARPDQAVPRHRARRWPARRRRVARRSRLVAVGGELARAWVPTPPG